jgi:histidinol-phosphatase (PHP family)
MLPPDGHVHSEWSWDTSVGSMERTCARAVELGLPSLAFTEHVDHTRWSRHNGGVRTRVPPPFDVDGYLACLARCRERYPGLRLLSGVELGEPHWHVPAVARVLERHAFDRVLGSVHTVRAGPAGFLEVGDAFREEEPAEVVRRYLAEAVRMVKSSDTFAVLAHIDYAARSWPADAGRYDPTVFEESYREVLEARASSARALEVNTKGPLYPQVLRWWHEAGGDAVAFGSDAHEPAALAREFPTAVAMVEAHGFRPGRDPHDFWRRA